MTIESQIINTDCLSGLERLEDSSVSLVLTDPPYNIGGHMKSRGSGVHRLRENHFSVCDWDNIDDSLWKALMQEFAENLYAKVKVGGAVVIFMAVIKVETIKGIFESAGFYYKTTGTWHKTNPMPRNMKLSFINSTESWIYFTKGKPSGTFNNDGKPFHDFIETSLTPLSEKRFGKHPTQKPLKLMMHFIKLLSNKDEFVLDPFCGTGTTLLAAKKLERFYIGYDMNEEYIEIANNRIKSDDVI